MSALATQAEGSLPRLSQVVARLEQHGWVRRTPDPRDGRYTLAILTDDGWAKVTEAAPGHVEEVRRLVFAPRSNPRSGRWRAVCEPARAVTGHSGDRPQGVSGRRVLAAAGC